MTEQIVDNFKALPSQAPVTRAQRRFASIDFLRGTAIVMMLFLHMVSWFLDTDAIFADINNAPLINFVALAILPYLGGLAGFFLLVSSIGNMVSMYKHLQAGKPVGDMIIKQVIGGFLLIVFAYLVESTLGYLGAFGDFLRSMDQPLTPARVEGFITTIGSRGFHFETIHTIAWCVLINGVVQGILSWKGAWRSIKNQVIAYTILAIVVVAITQPIWSLAEGAVAGGFPWNFSTGHEVPRPNIFDPATTAIDWLRGVFVYAIAGPMEPLTPYLAVSFIGSIIGIVISQPRERIHRHFVRAMMGAGMAMFVIGTTGVVWFVVTVLDGSGPGYGFEAGVSLYRVISFHRHWFNNPEFPATFTFPLAWLWQFLSLNGFGILATMFVLRMVEFRGWGAGFARKTTFVRRFGFIAFTNYNNQWYLWIVWFFTGLIFHGSPYHKLNWGFTLITAAIVFAMYHGIMLLWEKAGYVGTLEWAVGTIGYSLIPAKKARQAGGPRKSWWQKGQLDVRGAFYNADWQNIVEQDQIDHARLQDSKLAFKFALIGLASVIFMPVTFVILRLAIDAQKTEGQNVFNTVAKVLSIIGICIVLGVMIPLFFLTLGMLGLSL